MSEQRATLESIAPTVEEAIEKGLAELGLSKEQVEVEILDEGSRGLLKLGSRHARVRLTIQGGQGDGAPSGGVALSGDAESDEALSVARDTVVELLEKMKVKAEVSARLGESSDPRYGTPIMIDINGGDLSILIGRKAETLNALEYITRLIVGKELGRSAHITVDVEGYRLRRERNLRQLAQRMADQAIKSGRRQTLEPMPANERRLIHIELQENPDVTTESVGDDPRRKVTISPVGY